MRIDATSESGGDEGGGSCIALPPCFPVSGYILVRADATSGSGRNVRWGQAHRCAPCSALVTRVLGHSVFQHALQCGSKCGLFTNVGSYWLVSCFNDTHIMAALGTSVSTLSRLVCKDRCTILVP